MLALSGIIIMQLLAVGILFFWFILLGLEEPFGNTDVFEIAPWLLYSYPVLVVVCVAAGWLLYRRGSPTSALLISSLPVVAVLVYYLFVIALDWGVRYDDADGIARAFFITL